MKRALSLLLMLTLCLSLSACVTSGDEQTDYSPSISGNPENISNSDKTDSSNKEEENNNKPVHTHTWTDATCTTPKVCTCGAKEGKATGHKWKDATCSEPKTCTVCGATSGLTAGHSFSSGKCALCGKNDPDYVKVTMVWIPTKGGTKYHSHSGCSNMDNPEQVTKSQAESRGFTPCKRCY